MVAITCAMRSSALTQICTLLISCMKELSVEATKFGIIFCRSRQSRPSPRILQNLHEGSVLAHPHYTPLSTRRLLIIHEGFRKHSRDSAASNNLFCARRFDNDHSLDPLCSPLSVSLWTAVRVDSVVGTLLFSKPVSKSCTWIVGGIFPILGTAIFLHDL